MKKYKDFEYKVLGNGTAEIIAYHGNATELEVPDKIDGYTVTTIGTVAFLNCKSLISITIPDGVKSIGDYVFKDCKSLESITIPDCVTRIGSHAFYSCTSLKNITIPKSVISIGDCAFEDCKSLESITIPDCVTRIGSHAFYGCNNIKTLNVSKTALINLFKKSVAINPKTEIRVIHNGQAKSRTIGKTNKTSY